MRWDCCIEHSARLQEGMNIFNEGAIVFDMLYNIEATNCVYGIRGKACVLQGRADNLGYMPVRLRIECTDWTRLKQHRIETFVKHPSCYIPITSADIKNRSTWRVPLDGSENAVISMFEP